MATTKIGSKNAAKTRKANPSVKKKAEAATKAYRDAKAAANKAGKPRYSGDNARSFLHIEDASLVRKGKKDLVKKREAARVGAAKTLKETAKKKTAAQKNLSANKASRPGGKLKSRKK